MTQQEREQIKSLVQTPQWRTVIALAEELCIQVKTEQKSYDTEWDTIRDTLLADGEVRGIKRLLQTLQREAFGERDEPFGN